MNSLGGFAVSRKRASWLGLSFDLWQAGLEAQQVIALRLAKLAAGGAAATAEINRMTSEKIGAALEAQQLAATAALTGAVGRIPSRTVALYRRKMRANRNRLGAAKSPAPQTTRRRRKARPT